MSNQHFHDFLGKIATDSTLQDQLKDVNDEPTLVTRLVSMGAAHGYQFGPSDVTAGLAGKELRPYKELNDEELGLVTGGQIGAPRPPATSDGCTAAWTTLFGWCS